MQQDNFTENPSISTLTSKDGMHSIDNSITVQVKVLALIRRIETMETPNAPQASQVN